ncbi:MAG: class I SAM-dependent methyltransferase [Mariniphaga sp.]|nr:class I SAM-dependent methyltransferase [Mariniphaga sp.]MDD4227481.1 class I SAM-dependent methyltransferase [Mariniphaga sp.]MDD4425681.1 class I SAM-dependent methyltransferase [Mariniphaga sp.]
MHLTGNLPYGTETLEVISEAFQFNRWMYQTIRPHCQGSILEIGSGIGNISQFFIQDGAEITLSDFDASYLPRLESKFNKFENFKGIYRIDLTDKQLEVSHPELIGKFDTVFALNVVEHIEDHVLALQNMHQLLRPGGIVIILVPAFQSLYNGFDEQLGHFRRYRPETLKNILESVGFRVRHSCYFNAIAILGWFFSGNILRKRIIPGGQMRFFDKLVPIWKIFDLFTKRFVGISVIQTGEKTDISH